MRIPTIGLWVALFVGVILLGMLTWWGFVVIVGIVDPYREEFDDTPRERLQVLIPIAAAFIVAGVSLLLGSRALRRRTRQRSR